MKRPSHGGFIIDEAGMFLMQELFSHSLSLIGVRSSCSKDKKGSQLNAKGDISNVLVFTSHYIFI